MKTLLVALFFIFGCVEQEESFLDDRIIKFTSVNKLPVVEGKINNKKAFFIIDSGASISVLDEDQSNTYNFYYQQLEDISQAAGYGGNFNYGHAYDAEISLGGLDLYTEYKTKDISDIVDVIKQNDHIIVTGIIGSDIMKKYKFIINYSNNTITLGK